MTLRNIVLVVVTALLVCGVGGWLMAMPGPQGVAATSVVSVPAGSYVDASGDVVTPASAAATKPTTASVTGASAGGTASGSPVARVVVQSAWLARTSTVTGIPPRALQAYADAALSVQAADPECRVAWNTLAAIGTVESGNGTHGGAHLDADGTDIGAILGPVLDGTGGNAAVPDSDKGKLDGNATWDRAVGPMQILPSTWARYGVDANGDGRKDPENIDDASLAAARYLCVAGGDLATAAGWTAAIRAYNHDDVYVASVRAQANVYAQDARQ